MFKNDILAVLFTLVGVYLFIRYEKSNKYRLSIPFFILAVFTKQTAITGPLAIWAYLFFSSQKNWRKIIDFSLLFIVPSFLLFLVFNLLTKGNFFIDIFLVPRSISWDFINFVNYWRGAFYSFGFIFLPAIAFIILDKLEKGNFSLLSWMFIFSLLARYDIGIVGSSDNYFMETISLAGVLTVLLLSKLWSGDYSKKKSWLVAIFILAVLLVQQQPRLLWADYRWWLIVLVVVTTSSLLLRTMGVGIKRINYSKFFMLTVVVLFLLLVWKKYVGVPFPNFTLPPIPFIASSPSNLYPYQGQVERLIRDHPGRVLLDSESYLALSNGRDFEYIPMALKLRRQAGLWKFEDSQFFKDIGDKKFRFYVKSQGWTDPEIMYKIYEHYCLTQIVDAKAFLYEVFEPAETKYDSFVSEMRLQLDEVELQSPNSNIVLAQKLDADQFLLGFAFENDTQYAVSFIKMVSRPDFVALYRPLHSRNPNSSVIYQAKNYQEIEKIVSQIFSAPEYQIVLQDGG